MKNFKPLFGIGTSILFIFLGEYLIRVVANQPDNSMAKPALIIGYIMIVFFTIGILYGIRAMFKRKETTE